MFFSNMSSLFLLSLLPPLKKLNLLLALSSSVEVKAATSSKLGNFEPSYKQQQQQQQDTSLSAYIFVAIFLVVCFLERLASSYPVKFASCSEYDDEYSSSLVTTRTRQHGENDRILSSVLVGVPLRVEKAYGDSFLFALFVYYSAIRINRARWSWSWLYWTED